MGIKRIEVIVNGEKDAQMGHLISLSARGSVGMLPHLLPIWVEILDFKNDEWLSAPCNCKL